MAVSEHFKQSPGVRFLVGALSAPVVHDRRRRVTAWEAVLRDTEGRFGEQGYAALADAVSQSIEERQKASRRRRTFSDFIVIVGQQGSGKDTFARELNRRGYRQFTMSDVVRAVAPALGYSPDTTQGKIDAGHKMRWLFGKSVLMSLCVDEGHRKRAKRVVIVGPRSMQEVKSAKASGARIIGLVAARETRADTAIRLRRVTVDRLATEPTRVMTKTDFFNRERQERRRSLRMLRAAHVTVVTDRKVADLVDKVVVR